MPEPDLPAESAAATTPSTGGTGRGPTPPRRRDRIPLKLGIATSLGHAVDTAERGSASNGSTALQARHRPGQEPEHRDADDRAQHDRRGQYAHSGGHQEVRDESRREPSHADHPEHSGLPVRGSAAATTTSRRGSTWRPRHRRASSRSRTTARDGKQIDQTINLGNPTSPQMIYFKGEYDPSSNFVGVGVDGTQPIQGYGLLVVEDADLAFFQTGNFRWDGIVLVTGRNVAWPSRVTATPRSAGALIGSETNALEPGGYFEFYNRTTDTMILRASKQNIDMALQALYNMRVTSYREVCNSPPCSSRGRRDGLVLGCQQAPARPAGGDSTARAPPHVPGPRAESRGRRAHGQGRSSRGRGGLSPCGGPRSRRHLDPLRPRHGP